MTNVSYYTGCLGPDVRCEGLTAAGEQCKCRAIMEVNGIPYCRQHGNKELALAMKSEEKKV